MTTVDFKKLKYAAAAHGAVVRDFSDSDFGTIIGQMYGANIIRGDAGDFFIVPTHSRYDRHLLEDLANILKTLESIDK